MSAPRWARALLRRLAPQGREDEVVGDLEEAHRRRLSARRRPVALLLTTLETVDMAFALVRERWSGPGMSLLDLKLGLRMLIRYPGLTILGGLAIAFAICAGAGAFEFLTQVGSSRLPFPHGDRIVGIELWNVAEREDHRRAAFDYAVWRTELETVEELGVFDSVGRNLIAEGRGAHLVAGAVMDAAGFRITGVQPLLGRTLTEEDQRPTAPLVVVLGHETWRTVFASDPGVLGEVVRVGTEAATVVGVMPEGFTFPVSHQLWLPWRDDPTTFEPGEGPTISVFGRLVPGASMDDLQAEVERVTARLSAAHPETHEHLRAQVKPYARAMLGLPASISDLMVSVAIVAYNVPLVLFLILVCGNVALLMFARTAARESELVVRSALGAGRRRIVGQLFAEALVLASVASVLGLMAARYALRWGYHIVEVELWEGPLPFWFRPELSPRTIVYALLLTVTGAAVAGVLPALKATRGLGKRLQRQSAGGGGLRFGGIWTAVIVCQIGVSTVFPMVTYAVAMEGRDIRIFDMGIPAHEYLTARMAAPPPESGEARSEPDPAETAARPRSTFLDLEERLLADPRVAGVTWAEHAPRTYAGWHQIEVDGPTAPPQDERGHRMGSVDVETDFFETLGVRPRVGRDFHPADAEEGARVVIVNEGFVDYVLGGRNAIGVNFRYIRREGEDAPDEPGPWYEVVGVVQNLGRMSGYSSAVIYHPTAPGSMNPVSPVIHVRGDAAGFVPALREAAFDVDPTLRLVDPLTLDRIVDDTVEFYRFWIWILVTVSGIGLVLSLGGVYSVMAFTVARRTREIGVRVALGAPRRRIVLSIFRRPLLQVVGGISFGGLVTLVLLSGGDRLPTPREAAVFSVYLVIVACVVMTACVVPTRRALAIEPSEALRAE